MSNHLGQIYSTTKNAEKYIVLNSQNVELSGNVKLTNGNLEVSNNLIFNTFSVGDKITFKETNNTTAYNILHDNLKLNNDASFNNVDISGNLNIKTGVDITGQITLNANSGISGEVLTSQGASAPIWAVPSGGSSPPTPIFGSFTLPSNLSINNNQINDITTLTAQSGVTINGMSINSSTGIITLFTSGVYLMNIGFRVLQTTGVGGLYQSHIWLADSANNFINSINEFIDQGGSDSYRTLTITGHLVIVAPSINYQVRLRMYQISANNGISLVGGNISQGVSIQKI